jgi:hypothetical protein
MRNVTSFCFHAGTRNVRIVLRRRDKLWDRLGLCIYISSVLLLRERKEKNSCVYFYQYLVQILKKVLYELCHNIIRRFIFNWIFYSRFAVTFIFFHMYVNDIYLHKSACIFSTAICATFRKWLFFLCVYFSHILSVSEIFGTKKRYLHTHI